MRALDRFRRLLDKRPRTTRTTATTTMPGLAAGDVEAGLRDRLQQDPNDVEAFAALAERVRISAAEGHPAQDQQARAHAADDAVWALAEELAHSGRAWYPLIEMARLSLTEDHDAAMRRVATAAERDPSGQALAEGLHMLRESGHPADALNLGVGHWRPREHGIEAGGEIVLAAVAAGRHAEARRHLKALSEHPDQGRVSEVQAELERLIAQSEQGKLTDVRDAVRPGLFRRP